VRCLLAAGAFLVLQDWLTACPAESEQPVTESTTFKSNQHKNKSQPYPVGFCYFFLNTEKIGVICCATLTD
jgi:hypothetical protein